MSLKAEITFFVNHRVNVEVMLMFETDSSVFTEDFTSASPLYCKEVDMEELAFVQVFIGKTNDLT